MFVFKVKSSYLICEAVLLIGLLTLGMAYAGSVQNDAEIYSGYYSREQNYGELARASGKSHYIRFYPENRIVRLLIPFP